MKIFVPCLYSISVSEAQGKTVAELALFLSPQTFPQQYWKVRHIFHYKFQKRTFSVHLKFCYQMENQMVPAQVEMNATGTSQQKTETKFPR